VVVLAPSTYRDRCFRFTPRSPRFSGARSRTPRDRADEKPDLEKSANRARAASASKTEMLAPHSDPTARSAGQYARAAVTRLRLRLLLTLGVLAVATALLGRAFGLHSAWFIASEVALLATMFVISRYVLPLVERRDRGASGEEHVGGLLDTLAGDWRVIHDASLGHVDHILIGPPGIFTIETKSHPGPVRVARVHGHTIRQAQAQQRAIERVTGRPVEPMVVYSRAWVDRPLARRKGVRVLPARMLVRYLAGLEPALSQPQIHRAHELVARALLEHHAQLKDSARRRGPGAPRPPLLTHTRERQPAARTRDWR
jgi:hypothetical protein